MKNLMDFCLGTVVFILIGGPILCAENAIAGLFGSPAQVWGDIFLYLFLILVAMVMGFPIVYAISSALKPLDELFMFPPRIFPINPTFDNFSDLFVTMGKSWVTFSRYLFNKS